MSAGLPPGVVILLALAHTTQLSGRQGCSCPALPLRHTASSSLAAVLAACLSCALVAHMSSCPDVAVHRASWLGSAQVSSGVCDPSGGTRYPSHVNPLEFKSR
jgi:hypothetical protein